MMLLLYRFVLAPLAVMCLPWLALVHRKVREGIRLRRISRLTALPARAPIWIHAASGEFEYAKPVIRELKNSFPHLPILVTYFSPTYAKNVEAFPGVDMAVPLPLDLPGPVKSFLKRYHPRVLLIARTDFWPELLTQARAKGIPISVFSYTQRGRSAWHRPITRWRLNMVDRIYCVSTADEQALNSLNIRPTVHVLGDSRYDQVRARLESAPALPDSLHPQREIPCLVAGSTWSEDELVLLEAVTPLLKARQLKLILVPHEPSAAHLAALEKKLRTKGLTFVRYSSGRRWQDADIWLVDRVGKLAELYLVAQFAVVGGSFRQSVHSVMEALGAGCTTIVGPHHRNNREAIEFQHVFCAGLPAVSVATNALELREILTQRLNSDLSAFKSALITAVSERQGASRKLIDALHAQLDHSPLEH